MVSQVPAGCYHLENSYSKNLLKFIGFVVGVLQNLTDKLYGV